MSIPLLALALLCAAQPPGVAAAVRTADWTQRRIVGAAVVTAVAVVVLTALTGPILSGIDVSPPTFRLGAAAVLALWGIRWLILPAVAVPAGSEGRAGDALAVSLLFNPAFVLVAMAGGSEHGVVIAAVWVVLVLGATAALQLAAPRCPTWALRAGGVAVAAVAVVVALSAAVDAARTV